jgi:hypothetical protein
MKIIGGIKGMKNKKISGFWQCAFSVFVVFTTSVLGMQVNP